MRISTARAPHVAGPGPRVWRQHAVLHRDGRGRSLSVRLAAATDFGLASPPSTQGARPLHRASLAVAPDAVRFRVRRAVGVGKGRQAPWRGGSLARSRRARLAGWSVARARRATPRSEGVACSGPGQRALRAYRAMWPGRAVGVSLWKPSPKSGVEKSHVARSHIDRAGAWEEIVRCSKKLYRIGSPPRSTLMVHELEPGRSSVPGGARSRRSPCPPLRSDVWFACLRTWRSLLLHS